MSIAVRGCPQLCCTTMTIDDDDDDDDDHDWRCNLPEDVHMMMASVSYAAE